MFKVQINRQNDFPKPNLVLVLSLLFFGIIGFTVFQDFLHSGYHNYTFHFSESLLFKSFWLLFLPFLFLQFGLLKRMPFLVPATLIPAILHLFAFPLVVWILSALLFSHTYRFSSTLGYTISEDAYKYLMVYGTTALIYLFKQAPKKGQEEGPTIAVQRLTIGSGRNFSSIDVDEILYISSCSPYISIRTRQKSHLQAESLKSIMNKLDHQQFVRVHKSTIVNIHQVRSYRSRLNGDYDILLKNEEEIRLSRNYALRFKELLG